MMVGAIVPWYGIGTREWVGLDVGGDGTIVLGFGVVIALLVTLGGGLFSSDVAPARFALLGLSVLAAGFAVTARQATAVLVREGGDVARFESFLYIVGAGAALAVIGASVVTLRASRVR